MVKESVISNKPAMEAIQVKKRHSTSFIYSVMLIVYFPVMFYLRNFESNKSSGLSIAYTLPVLFLLVEEVFLLFHVFSRRLAVERSCKILLALFICSTILAFCVMGSGFERIVSLHVILMSLILYSHSPINKKEWNILYGLFVASIVLVLLDNLLDANINTNTSGFLLSMLFCATFARYLCVKKCSYLLFSLLCFGLQFVFVSRSAMLGSALFFLFSLCLRRKHFSSKAIFWLLLILAILGILFAWFYSEVLYPYIGRDKIVIFGKDLFTGRENIWHYTFLSIKDHFWFGVGSDLNAELIEHGFDAIYSNAHNQPLGMLASFGIFAFSLFYISFAHFVARLYRKKPCSASPLVFVAVIFLICFFETYFFVQMQWLALIISYGLICNAGVKGR